MESLDFRVRPLPIAPRPFSDETLRSWATRIGAWYGLDGTELVEVLCHGTQLSVKGRFFSLERCEFYGETPSWITNLLADAARLSRQKVQALRQDEYARWTPTGSLWKVLTGNFSRYCLACLQTNGVVHDRRLWRTGWASYCPDHQLVFGSNNQAPSDYAVQLESALMAGVRHPRGRVKLPWPISGNSRALPLLAFLATLAELADYLCFVAKTSMPTDRFPKIGSAEDRAAGFCRLRLVDVATIHAVGSTDGNLSRITQTSSWRRRRGIANGDHHILMTGLGWLLSDWSGNLKRLLTSREFSTPQISEYIESWNSANIKTLQHRASNIMEPFRSGINDL